MSKVVKENENVISLNNGKNSSNEYRTMRDKAIAIYDIFMCRERPRSVTNKCAFLGEPELSGTKENDNKRKCIFLPQQWTRKLFYNNGWFLFFPNPCRCSQILCFVLLVAVFSEIIAQAFCHAGCHSSSTTVQDFVEALPLHDKEGSKNFCDVPQCSVVPLS
ncbi:hypothetical protein T4B_1686 [Trichinella pseudospiralis]|uniref:Uncharacterized protein n=2 Tax=Trichinella pseudospiralis TaxID=6337 RepID=A0A0V1GLN1_TRIPS|nr:hypothetical protein T4B_1686 [Trichinella pseudospiralis]